MSLHQKRKLVSSIEGCRPSLHNGQLLVSTGNSSIDHIIGGGMPLGTILLIEEDKYNSYAKVLCRYFLAEGVYRKHSVFLATKEDNADDFVRKLPQAIEEVPEKRTELRNVEEEMRIAWRYNDLPKVSLEQGSKRDYHFDLSRNVPQGDIEACDITSIGSDENFGQLQKALKEKLSDKCFKLSEESEKKLLRICLNSLGSPLWWTKEDFEGKLVRFLVILRSLMRNSTAVCMISIPTHLFHCLEPKLLARLRNLVDYAIEIESFSGAEAETNAMYREYHGLVHIHRITAVNTLAPFRPETFDLAFKQRRKKFVVEKLHLPPDIAELSDTLVPRPGLSCSSAAAPGTRSLDF
uniref:Elongator complex protein 4 n=1 Tax=Phlebotomus papatasi TaxID=29031 RepID=A0A1B0DFP0_PHLPP